MTEGKPQFPGFGADDRIVVEEMLRDPTSGQWYECREFVKRCVQLQAKNIPQEHWEDIVHEVMMRVEKFLPTFKHQCKLRTWLFGIIHSCIIDDYRKWRRAEQFTTSLDDPYHDGEQEKEGEAFTTHSVETVEHVIIVNDEIREGIAALQEYVSTHANTMRNRRIVNMVIFEGRSLEEAAEAVGCSAAVVGYVVRSAQRYAREKVRYQR